uniref:Methyltransferase type 11 domain-containing protein n=1 Tax=Chlamydomonas leiostraca TaxID=1034604 RepID=A0A7S0WZR0_9CHLO|mmetsp:Transcript_5102/g.12526  ORF Transcript_5102/g.12526 Transcript_5102/m.12526 type:complete len:157 (+) Transcript_5102:226-696(+)
MLNLFRVLMPGGLESRPRIGLVPCKECRAHQFDSHFKQRCACGKSEDGLPLQRFAPGSFDTVVDAFGLCSHDDPVAVLKQAARLVKPEGRIILMEHGQASWGAWNKRLDEGAEDHKRKWGCWWNRDILAIVTQAGLEIESVSRWHFGTTYLIIAKP